jgi:hypothetical protein
MTYDSTIGPMSSEDRREARNALLNNGWYILDASMPKDALLRVPVKMGPTFDDANRVDTRWTEIWCNCLWAKLVSMSQGTARQFAIELARYKKAPKLRKAILVMARIAARPNREEKIAIDAAIQRLDRD